MVLLPAAVTVAAGSVFMLTTVAVDVPVQPVPTEIVNVYEPTVFAQYVALVAPVIGLLLKYHWYVNPPVEGPASCTESPMQYAAVPAGVMVDTGDEFADTVMMLEVPLHPVAANSS